MIQMNGKHKGFTLVELMVVVGMIALLMGAMVTAATASSKRARIQRATNDVKVITQAILGYENFARGGNYKLPAMERQDADSSSIGFLLGHGESTDTGGQIPALLVAALQGGGKMLDPWGTPYKVTIREGGTSVKISTAAGNMSTSYCLPNFYRLGDGERELIGGGGK